MAQGAHVPAVHDPAGQYVPSGEMTPAHAPVVQVSLWVQGLPSSQVGPVLGVKMQPVVVLHESVVQGLLSLHVTKLATHVPPEQMSPLVHALLSVQAALLFG